jgi:Flp pilus assembly protein TadD
MRSAALLLTLLASIGSAHDRFEPTCVHGGQKNPDIVAGRAALQRTPTMLGKRMELANLLQRAGCYDDAVHVLEEGEKYNPLSLTLKFSLRRARNMVREEHYFAGTDKAEAAARLNRNTERCTRLSEVAACDDVLSEQPDNVKILMAKGDSLVKAHRPEDATAVYARAAELAPNDTALTGKLQALKRVHRKEPTELAAMSAAAEAMVEPQAFSNVAEATRSN